jgi:hypothetical protein
MAQRMPGAVIRGFLVQEGRVGLDTLAPNDAADENSFFTQAGSRPGSSVAEDDLGTYRPHVSGAQEGDLTATVVSAGRPGVDTGAGVAYRPTAEAEATTRGWNEPNLVSGYAVADWTTASNWLDVDVVTCPRSQRVVAFARDNTDTVDPSVWVYDPATRDWDSIGELEVTSGAGELVCLLLLKANGRLLALTCAAGLVVTPRALVRYSDDDGQTWAEYSRPLLPGLDSAVTRLSWIEDALGNILLLAVDDATGDVWQFVSVDSGMSFTEVDDAAAAGTGFSLSLAHSGQLLLVYVDMSDDTRRILLDDAFDPIGAASNATVNGSGVENVEEARACVDADGVVYVLMSVAASDLVRLSRSLDHGSTFETYDEQVIATGGGIANPTDHRHQVRAVTATGGDLLAMVRSVHSATTPATDGSLISLYLGGWSNLEAVPQTSADGRLRRFSWADESDQDANGIFLPTEILANQGWTATGGAETLVAGYHKFETAAANSSAALTFTGPTGNSAAVLFEGRLESGGSIVSDHAAFHWWRRNGASEKAIKIRFGPGQFRVVDNDAGGQITLATVSWEIGEMTQFLLLAADSNAGMSVYYRHRTSSVWLLAWQGTLGIEVTASTDDEISLGNFSTGTADTRWGLVAWTTGAPSRAWGHGLADVAGFTEALSVGKALGTAPYPVRDQVDADGNMLFLSAGGGPARFHEAWSCPAEYDYGVREIDPVLSPSPSARWRSTDTAEQILTWDLGVDSRLGHSWAIGMALVGANFHQAALEASTDADPTTWVTLGWYLGLVAQSVTFERHGDLIVPAAGTPPGDFFFGAETLTGGHVILEDTPPRLRRIASQQGGGWHDHGVQAVLRVEGITGAEPTSGTCHIVAPGGVAVMHTSAPTAYRRFRLRIPEQDTPDGYFELGAFVLGSVWALGQQWSRGWSERYVPVTRVDELDSGTVFVDPRGPLVEGSMRREITVSFQDGIDDSRVSSILPPPYLSAGAGTPGLVARKDVHRQVAGILRATRGGSLPSCALLEVPPVSGTILRPRLWSYGRLAAGQAAQFNNVQGREERDEVYRGESLTHVQLL